MSDTTGIIPAAGRAARWGGYLGGYLKELLPVGDGVWVLDHALAAMVHGGARRALIVTDAEKIGPLARYLHPQGLDVGFLLQHGAQGNLWSAIRTALPWCHNRVLMAMPDTLYPVDALAEDDAAEPLILWTFATETPERFGIIGEHGIIYDKPTGYHPPQDAWGLVAWSSEVTRHWLAHTYETFTAALNHAVDTFGYVTRSLAWYQDFASWEDYQAWMRR